MTTEPSATTAADGTAATGLENMLTNFLLQRAGILPAKCAAVKSKAMALLRGVLCAAM